MSRKWRDLQKRIATTPHRPRHSDGEASPPRSKRFLTAQDIDDIVRTYRAGETTQRIGSQYGISKTRVATLLREQGATLRRQGLTEEQVSEAERLYDQGKSLATLGIQFNVSHSTIANILKRRGVNLRPRPGWTSSL